MGSDGLSANYHLYRCLTQDTQYRRHPIIQPLCILAVLSMQADISLVDLLDGWPCITGRPYKQLTKYYWLTAEDGAVETDHSLVILYIMDWLWSHLLSSLHVWALLTALDEWPPLCWTAAFIYYLVTWSDDRITVVCITTIRQTLNFRIITQVVHLFAHYISFSNKKLYRRIFL